MSTVNESILFNFLQGSDITGESSYDIYKQLYPDGTAQGFMDMLTAKFSDLPNHITLTRSEYDDLVSSGNIDEDAFYFITDDADSSPVLIQYVTFAASAWVANTDSTEWTQTVSAPQITSNDSPLISKYLPFSTGKTESKAYNKALGILSSGLGETGDGVINWKCWKKPETDITVGLIKVMA